MQYENVLIDLFKISNEKYIIDQVNKNKNKNKNNISYKIYSEMLSMM